MSFLVPSPPLTLKIIILLIRQPLKTPFWTSSTFTINTFMDFSQSSSSLKVTFPGFCHQTHVLSLYSTLDYTVLFHSFLLLTSSTPFTSWEPPWYIPRPRSQCNTSQIYGNIYKTKNETLSSSDVPNLLFLAVLDRIWKFSNETTDATLKYYFLPSHLHPVSPPKKSLSLLSSTTKLIHHHCLHHP